MTGKKRKATLAWAVLFKGKIDPSLIFSTRQKAVQYAISKDEIISVRIEEIP